MKRQEDIEGRAGTAVCGTRQVATPEQLVFQSSTGAAGERLSVRIPDVHVPFGNRFQRISVVVVGVDVASDSQGANFNPEKVDIAVRQAMSLWGTAAPVQFDFVRPGEDPHVRLSFLSNGITTEDLGTASGFISSTPTGPVGVAGIEIDCDRVFFIDRFFEPQRPAFEHPHDLIATITHELGHALGLDHPPKDPVTGTETEPALMSESVTRVGRLLFPFDIREVQRLWGAIRLATPVAANLQASAHLIDASPGIEFQNGPFGVLVFGPRATATLLDALVPAKGQVVNALRLRFTTVSRNVFINRVQTFDGSVPLQEFSLSARSLGNEGLAGRSWDIRLGFLGRPRLANDLTVRMELMFTDREGQPQVSHGVVHVQEIGVDTVSQPLVDPNPVSPPPLADPNP